MKLQLNKRIFEKIIVHSTGFIDEHSVSGIFENILIEAVNTDQIGITATDSNAHTGIISIINVESMSNAQSFLVNAKKLDSIIRSLDCDVLDMELDEKGKLKIIGGKSKFDIPVSSISEYVERPEISGEYFELNVGKLLFLIKKTYFTISSELAKQNMRGGFLSYENGKIIMVGTDSFQLGYAEIEEDKDLSKLFKQGILIAKEDLSRLRKILEAEDPNNNIKVTIQENSISINIVNQIDKITTTVWLRLLGTDYVSYKSIFRDSVYKIAGTKKDLQKVLKRATITTSKDSPVLKFDISANTILIESSDDYSYKFSEPLNVSYSGKNIVIGISSKYLNEMLSMIDTEYFVIDVESENSIIMIYNQVPEGTEQDRKYFYILMPMDVN